jgi:hypothetical protein
MTWSFGVRAALASIALAAFLGASGAACDRSRSATPSAESARPATLLAETAAGTEVARLATLARVWGFLEYHHPGLASGEVDWDRALLDAIPAARSAQTRPAHREVLAALLAHAGPPPEEGEPSSPKVAAMAWLPRDPLIDDALERELGVIRRAARTADSRRVSFAPNVGNAVFPSEGEDDLPDYPGEALRLLALFRYWNAINYFFPYRHQIDGGWDGVLEEFIPRFLGAADAPAFHLVVKEMVARINDGHGFVTSEVLNHALGTRMPRLSFRVVEDTTVVIAPRRFELTPELRPGDIVTSIGDTPIERARERLRPIARGSNPTAVEATVSNYLARTNEPTLALTVVRGEREHTLSLPTYPISDLVADTRDSASSPRWKVLEGDIGYVDMGTLEADDIEPAMSALTATRGIVFDMRAYPEFILFQLIPHLTPSPAAFFRFTKPDAHWPGAFQEESGPLIGGGRSDTYQGQVIVLVDETTMSRAEYFTMALQSVPGALVVGSQTAGADGNVSTIQLPGGIVAGMSGIGIYYPDGRPTQRVGIAVDVEVRPTIEGLREGRDEVLARAIELIRADPAAP